MNDFLDLSDSHNAARAAEANYSINIVRSWVANHIARFSIVGRWVMQMKIIPALGRK